MDSIVIASAFVLDLIFGDPRRLPHPVRMIGWSIQKLEKLLRHTAKTPGAEKTAGVLLVVLIVLPVYFVSFFLLLTVFLYSLYAGCAISALLAYTTLSARGLGDAALKVLRLLEAGDLPRARQELSMIVGRDTADLDEKEIARAVIETVAENASDGVVAPLFYMALGGPALALAYKAVNTLDSMVGYKNEKYLHFGWAAARLDDVANYVPARITAVLICLSSGILRRLNPRIKCGAGSAGAAKDSRDGCPTKWWDRRLACLFRNPQSAFASSWRIMLRDGRNHPSPNSGHPEAAMAGAVGVRLGGPSSYFGTMTPKPYLGEELAAPSKKDIALSVRLLYCATLLAVFASALCAAALAWNA